MLQLGPWGGGVESDGTGGLGEVLDHWEHDDLKGESGSLVSFCLFVLGHDVEGFALL